MSNDKTQKPTLKQMLKDREKSFEQSASISGPKGSREYNLTLHEMRKQAALLAIEKAKLRHPIKPEYVFDNEVSDEEVSRIQASV